MIDDGIICALGEGRWYLTFTSAGAETVEATLKDWADTWGHDVHIVDLTAGRGAINVAGPPLESCLRAVTATPLDAEAFPYLQHREITVAGVPCRAIRLGFVGELSFELHHESDRSVELWDALLEAGAAFSALAPTASMRCASCGSRRATSWSVRTPTSTRPRQS